MCAVRKTKILTFIVFIARNYIIKYILKLDLWKNG